MPPEPAEHPVAPRDELLAVAQKALRRTRNKLRAVQGDLARIDAAPALLAEAELLKTAKVKPFAKEACVLDYSEHPPRERRIALDPTLPLHKQLEQRFKQGRRLLNSADTVLKRLAQVEAELLAWEATTAALADSPIEAPRETLLQRHPLLRALLEPRTRAATAPAAEGRERPYRSYRSLSGREIWVGKSGTANDTMTFKHASPHATWLHASGYQGAHVVVQKKRGEQLDPQTLRDACLLAAHFSKAPLGPVEVTVTDVKFVRKFRGAKTGQVRTTREVHQRIENDGVRVKTLLAGDAAASS